MPSNTPVEVDVDRGQFAIVGRTTGTDPAFGSGGTAVSGINQSGNGVLGSSGTSTGVLGISDTDVGVTGLSTNGEAVVGLSQNQNGVHGTSFGEGRAGVWGESQGGEGVHGESNSKTWAGVTAIQNNPVSTAPALWAETRGDGPAGRFIGEIRCEGDLYCTGKVWAHDVYLTSGDCAEEFVVANVAEAEPGTVMIFQDDEVLVPCCQAYDRRVAGVIAGAGGRRPAIVLRGDGGVGPRAPLALLGRVSCKVDASAEPINVGDLLTTSVTVGHAMRADPQRATGSILGKALKALDSGIGLIPILVCLQ